MPQNNNGHSFFQMIAIAKEGGTITTYSDRFSLAGMTGDFAPAIERAARNIHGTSGPGLQDNLVDHQHIIEARAPQGAVPVGAAGGATAAGQAASVSIAYTAQTGLTKYAPMPGHPGTKITKQGSASPRYPTSSVSFYKTFAPTPHQKTTITMSETFSTTSVENTVCCLLLRSVAFPAADPRYRLRRLLTPKMILCKNIWLDGRTDEQSM